MSAQRRRAHGEAPVRVALLGVGNVGRAVLARLSGWSGVGPGAAFELVYVADSRRAYCPLQAVGAQASLQAIEAATSLPALPVTLGASTIRVVVDATASDTVAARHADWLGRGVHVVTACKLGQGASLERWRAIRQAGEQSGTCYGDRATVGAGLPLLDTLRALQAGGDRIHAIAGVLSGSLAWLLDHHDGSRPFSALVGEARVAGLTEPDPREDLSGADVRRKLLILARTAGVPLEEGDVAVAPLLAEPSSAGTDDAVLSSLDAPMQARLDEARRRDARLQFVARLHRVEGRWHARAGLEALPANDPLAAGRGTDNKVAIWSDRYRERPLVIQGPGAGAGVTAAALLDDVLGIARQAAPPSVKAWPVSPPAPAWLPA